MTNGSRLTTLLAGASLVTLAMLAPAGAQLYSADVIGDLTVDTDQLFLELATGVDVSGEVTVNARIGSGNVGPGGPDNTAVYFQGNNNVGGEFVNNGTIVATGSGATAIYLADTGISEGLTNNGTIRVESSQTTLGSTSVTAVVNYGVYWTDQSGDPDGVSVSLTNNGDIDLRARAYGTSGTEAIAFARLSDTAIRLRASQTGEGGAQALAKFDNQGSLSYRAIATAEAGDTASAVAFAYNGISLAAYDGDISTASLVNQNDGEITIGVTALAADGRSGDDLFPASSAVAKASMSFGIYEIASSEALGVQRAEALIDNQGSIAINVAAGAFGTSAAAASARFSNGSSDGMIAQYALGSGQALAQLTNSGRLTVDLTAIAEATSGTARASAAFASDAVKQFASAGLGVDRESAVAALTNSGDIFTILAIATAEGTDATARAGYSSDVIAQYAGQAADTRAELVNSGTMDIVAAAQAYGTTANAYASVAQSADDFFRGAAIAQDIAPGTEGGTGTAVVTNSGNMRLSAQAIAGRAGGQEGALAALATANAAMNGIRQEAGGGDDLFMTVDNQGVFELGVGAIARALGEDGAADARAAGTGVEQVLEKAAAATLTFTNDGLFGVFGNATASGSGSGSVDAQANMVGYRAYAGGSEQALTLNVENTGSLRVAALASGSRAEGFGATAGAYGMQVYSVTSTGATGSIQNSGMISVQAIAMAASSSFAAARGIDVALADNQLTITNAGSISALAFVGAQTGGSAQATAIRLVAPSFTPPNTGEATIANDGGLILAATSRENRNTRNVAPAGSAPFDLEWGSAIDTLMAANPFTIALRGGLGNKNDAMLELALGAEGDPDDEAGDWGVVFGNIEMSADDVIEVTDGTTFFNGIVNSGGAFDGDLSIGANGRFILANRDQGAAQANVDAFAVAANGTIAFELDPDNLGGSPGNPGEYPQVFADTASLDGTIEVRALAGFYQDGATAYFNNVIEAGLRTGTFDESKINPLFDLQVIYDSSQSGAADGDIADDGANNVDLRVTYKGAGEVDAGSGNRGEVGDAIQDFLEGYDPNDPDNSATREAFAAILAQLPTLNADEYFDALQQLAGTPYASYLQSALNSTNQINEAVLDRIETWNRLNGEVTGSAADLGGTPATVLLPDRRETASFWGRAFGTFGEHDGDGEAAAYDVRQEGVLLGGDVGLGANGFVGITGGYFHADLDFDGDGAGSSEADYDGFQVGGYAGWDNGQWYVRGIAGYARYSADVRRDIAVGAAAGTAEGEADADVLSGYGEAGYRWRIGGGRTALTPFVGLSGSHAELDGFEETGFPGANLDVSGGEADKLASRVGVRIAGAFEVGGMTLAPEAKVAWEHDFSDDRASFQASFLDVPGTDVDIASSAENDDSILIGLGATAAVSERVEAKLAYDGRFNEDFRQHTLFGRVTYKLIAN